jgi:hypothetical protein
MKRSHAVVAVLTAATVGGAAYSMMPSERCQRAAGGAPLDPSSPACRSSGSGATSSGYHGSRSFFGSSDSGGARASGGSGSGASASAGTARGGFGGSAGAFGGHGGT